MMPHRASGLLYAAAFICRLSDVVIGLRLSSQARTRTREFTKRPDGWMGDHPFQRIDQVITDCVAKGTWISKIRVWKAPARRCCLGGGGGGAGLVRGAQSFSVLGAGPCVFPGVAGPNFL